MAAKSSARRRQKRGSVANNSVLDRPLDRLDRQILRRLQEDGRQSISDLAAEVHLSVSPCLARVRRLEGRGYITGYFAQLDPARMGLSLLAIMAVQMDRTTPDVFEGFRQSMLAFDEVLECLMVGGGFDYLMKVRVKDMAGFRGFLEGKMGHVRGVQHTHTYFVMEEVKSTHSLPIAGS